MRHGIDDFLPHDWSFVIGESLVKRDLVSLCARVGVELPGRRLESLSEYTLAQALTDIVTANEPARGLILDRIRTSNRMLAEKALGMSVEELSDAVKDPLAWPQSATAGRLLWVLASDPRAGVRKLASGFRGLLAESVDRLGDAPRRRESAPVLHDAVAEVKDAAEKLTELASQERRRAERDGRRIRDLEAQVAELRSQAAERDQRLAARKAELDASRSETQKALHEMESLRARLKAQPPESWESERRRLEHEVKSLAARLEEERAARGAALEAAMREAQETLAAERAQSESLRRDVETAKKETAWLREKLKTPVAPPAPVRRDPDRVAVFAEAQSLYFLAAARHSRIDYRRIMERCLEARSLGRALAYIVEVPGTNPSAFKQVLASQGFQVRSKPGRSAGVWTAGLEADLRDAARTCGRVTIATANTELATVLGSLAADGVHVTLVSFDDPSVASLRSAAHEFIPIDSSMLMALPPR